MEQSNFENRGMGMTNNIGFLSLKGGAAGWCFHNGGLRTTGDQQRRRSFDLRAKRLLDQLDEEETKVFQGAKSVLLEQRKKD
jgi:hypothetical protein